MMLKQTPRLTQKLALECSVCLEHMNTKKQNDDCASAVLFGTKDPYVMCPGCWQQVPQTTYHDPDYRQRARVALFNKYGMVVRIG